MKTNPSQILAENIRMLMLLRNVEYKHFDKSSIGITSRHVRLVARQECGVSIEKLAEIARVFGVEPWEMLIPYSNSRMLADGEIKKLIALYVEADQSDREFITKFIERESAHKLKA